MDVQLARCLLIHQMLGTRISDTLTLRINCLTRENGQDMIEIHQVKTKRYKKPISKELAKLIQRSIEYTQEKFGDTKYIFVNEKEPNRPIQYMTIKTKVMSMIQEKQLKDDHGELFGFAEKPTVVQKVSKNVTYRVLDTKKKTAAVVGVGGKKGKKVTSVTIAKTVKINGVTYKVTKIGKNAFKGCKYLKKITIGSNVKKIEKGAFANCRKLASINMKKANGITSIGSKAFSRINSKAKVSVPSKKLSKYTRMLKKAGLPKKAVIKK